MIEFPTFLKLMDKLSDEKNLEEELDEAFRSLDTSGSGIISSVEFRTLLTQQGEKMSKEETDKFLQFADCDGRGEINWRGKSSLITMVTAGFYGNMQTAVSYYYANNRFPWQYL